MNPCGGGGGGGAGGGPYRVSRRSRGRATHSAALREHEARVLNRMLEACGGKDSAHLGLQPRVHVPYVATGTRQTGGAAHRMPRPGRTARAPNGDTPARARAQVHVARACAFCMHARRTRGAARRTYHYGATYRARTAMHGTGSMHGTRSMGVVAVLPR